MVQALGRLAGVSRALKTLLQPLLATTIRQELTAWRNRHRLAINDIFEIPTDQMENNGWRNLEHTYIRYLGASATMSSTSCSDTYKEVRIYTKGPYYLFESPFNTHARDEFDTPAGTIKIQLRTRDLACLTRLSDLFTYRLIENEQYDTLDQDSVAWAIEEDADSGDGDDDSLVRYSYVHDFEGVQTFRRPKNESVEGGSEDSADSFF